MKGKSLALRICTMVFSALTFVVFAFDHILFALTTGNKSTTTGISWSEWSDFLAKNTSDEGIWFQIARIMVIITIVLACIALVCALLQIFLNSKVLNLIAKIVGIVLVVVSILVLVFTILGTIATASSNTILGTTISSIYFPNIGVGYITVMGIVAGALTISCGKKKKSK